MFIGDLAQQPVLALLAAAWLQPDHDPLALHAVAVEDEMEMPLGDGLARILARDRLPGAVIPQHHRAAAILALGDRALERRIGHGMVFGADREALVVGIEAGAARDRPALEHAIQLQPEIPMEARRVVLLHHEDLAGLHRELSGRLGGAREIALGVVRGEGVGFLGQ